MQTQKAKESNYHAFGSDDMFASERPQKKSIADRLESSKQVFGKIGSFFSNSVKNIVKHKEARGAPAKSALVEATIAIVRTSRKRITSRMGSDRISSRFRAKSAKV